MSTTNAIKLDLGYEGTDFERKMTINDVSETDAAIETVRAKVKAINESLAGGTAGGLDAFFRADDFNASENVGSLKEIKSCTVVNNNVTTII